jgi:hypothetical protein
MGRCVRRGDGGGCCCRIDTIFICQTATLGRRRPARPGDPVFQRRMCLNREAAAYWMPRMKRGMTPRETRFLVLAARMRPSFALSFRPPQQRAQGMPDARCTRGRLCSKKAQALATKGTPQQPAFPARWFYGLYVISPVTGLFCHRHSQRCLHELSASVGAPGPYDFAVREAARTSAHSPRPPHPALYVRDDRETPLMRRRDGIGIFLFLPGCQEKFRIFRNCSRLDSGSAAHR